MTQLRQAVASGGRRLTTLGVIAIVLGILTMLAPGVAGLSIAMVLGFLVSGAGILRMLWAFQASSFGKGFLTLALGTLTLICGLVLFANPVIGAGLMTIMLTAYLIVDGVFEIVVGVASRGGIWLIVGGVVSMLLGVMLWSQYPLSGAWAMGMLLGIKLLFVGVIMVTGGSTLRAAARA